MGVDYQKWCDQCRYGQFDMKRGIICIKTDDKPQFESSCPIFEIDNKKRIKAVKRELNMKARQDRDSEVYNFGYQTLFRLFYKLIPAAIFALLVSFDLSEYEAAKHARDGTILLIVLYFIFSIKYLRFHERGVVVDRFQVVSYHSFGFALKPLFYHKFIKVDLTEVLPEWRTMKENEIQENVQSIVRVKSRTKKRT